MNPTLHAVMAYEDLSIAKIAKEKWDYLVHTLNGFDFELCLWKFDALRIPELRAVAVNDAIKAQMVFVATHGTGELPSEVKVWIEQWLNRTEQKRDAARLLTLLSDPLPDKSGISAFSQFAYLQQVARKGAMDFLVSTAAQRDPVFVSFHMNAKNADSTVRQLTLPAHQPDPDCGNKRADPRKTRDR